MEGDPRGIAEAAAALGPDVSRDQVLDLIRQQMEFAIGAGFLRVRVEDQSPSGESITVGGRSLVNFGTAAYLGLNVDGRLKRGAIDAIERFGLVYSSSTVYSSVDLYTTLENKLGQIFPGTILVPTTTTLGHLSALPVLVAQDDLVLMDRQVHATVKLAGNVLAGLGVQVDTIAHNDLDVLRGRIDAEPSTRSVWYLADGIYSMFGDTAPVADIAALLDEYPNLHAYFDDAHGIGWTGERGRGYVLSETPLHDRLVVIGSLTKSWGSGGAVLILPDGDLAQRVLLTGTTFAFSGPLHPAELGAAVAAADIHLSDELPQRQRQLEGKIDYVRQRIIDAQLPAVSLERTPIWFIRIGSQLNTAILMQRLLDEGFFTNIAAFPAVAWGMDGIRFATSLWHTDENLERFMDALERHVPELAVPYEGTLDIR